MNLLTIIITCYNNDWCVADAINTVKNITYDKWECIIVNDGSTDNSESVIKDSIINDNRFKLVTTENQGVAKARNLGLKLANTEYCMFLDSDDVIYPEYPKRAMKMLLDNPKSPLYFGGYRCTGMLNLDALSKWKGYAHMLICPCVHTTAIFKRERALEIGGLRSELDAYEDYEFWIRYLYHNSDNIINTQEIMIEYRTRPNSRHFSHTEELLAEIREQIKELNKDIYEEYELEMLQQSLSEFVIV